MELIERVPIRTIMWLSQTTYPKFRADCIKSSQDEGEPKLPTEDAMKQWYSVLQQFCATNIKTKGITKRIYSYSINTPAGLGGRLFAGGSLQGIWGKFRGLLMRDTTTDIDMSNSHPCALRYVCHLHNISCPHLEYYINNRDECLKQFQTRSIGKHLYLKATNNDKLNTTSNQKLPENFTKYDAEMKKIQKQLIHLPQYTELVDTVPDTKTYNYNGSAMNRILCYYENIILQHAIHILNKRGLELAVLMFDGCMVYGNHYSDKELLDEITEYVERKMPNLQMKWTYKEHDQSLKVPDDFDGTVVDNKNKNDKNFVCNDLEAAEKLYSLYPHWKYSEGVLYVFDDKSGLWKSDKITHNLIVTRFTDKLWVGISNRRIEMMEASKAKSYGNTTTLFMQMIEKLKTLCIDDHWIKRSQSSSLGKLLFNNGYLDMRTNIFYPTFNPDIFFVGKIYHDYAVFDQDDEIYMESIKKRLFYDPLGKSVGDCFILNLARGLAGDVMKRIFFGLGYGNTGKSTITKAFLKSCGDYIGTFDGNNFAYRNTGSDQASQNRWIMLLKDKRLIFSNEIKSTISLNGNAIKMISSGGDPVVGRGHCGNEIEFYLSFLCVVFANDLPKITPYDDAMNNRTRVVSYSKPYSENPTEFELLMDPNIDAEFDTLRFQRCFVELFIRQYWRGRQGEFKDEPAEMTQAKEDWIGSDIGCISGFLRDYEITNNISDYVRSSEIEEWIEQGKYGLTMKKFGMEMKQYTMKNRFENVVNDQKKINGKVPRVWFGIKRIELIMENIIV